MNPCFIDQIIHKSELLFNIFRLISKNRKRKQRLFQPVYCLSAHFFEHSTNAPNCNFLALCFNPYVKSWFVEGLNLGYHKYKFPGHPKQEQSIICKP